MGISKETNVDQHVVGLPFFCLFLNKLGIMKSDDGAFGFLAL